MISFDERHLISRSFIVIYGMIQLILHSSLGDGYILSQYQIIEQLYAHFGIIQYMPSSIVNTHFPPPLSYPRHLIFSSCHRRIIHNSIKSSCKIIITTADNNIKASSYHRSYSCFIHN
jgi:hypothetical protein